MMKILYFLLTADSALGLLGKPRSFRHSRHVLHIDEEIAKLIDDQLWRQNHLGEIETAWQKKNAAFRDLTLPDAFDFDWKDPPIALEDQILTPRQLEKDRRLANENPSAYCVDRCLSTGNCDVLENMFHLSPSQVVTFCKECVLSDGEEPCDIPDMDNDYESYSSLRP